MSSLGGFHWVIPPSQQLIPGVKEYGRRVEASVYAVASRWGADIQNKARQDAVWQDRTGNARGGLFYAVEGFGLGQVIGEASAGAKELMKEVNIETGRNNLLIIALSHTVYYGKFLELSNGGRYAIIMSTLEASLPALERQMQSYINQI
jgi:hypothetical protein